MSAATNIEPRYEVLCMSCKRVTGWCTAEHSTGLCPECLDSRWPVEERDQLGLVRGVGFALRIEALFVAFALASYYAIRVLS